MLNVEISPRIAVIAGVVFALLLGGAFWWKTNIVAVSVPEAQTAGAREQSPEFIRATEAEHQAQAEAQRNQQNWRAEREAELSR